MAVSQGLGCGVTDEPIITPKLERFDIYLQKSCFHRYSESRRFKCSHHGNNTNHKFYRSCDRDQETFHHKTTDQAVGH